MSIFFRGGAVIGKLLQHFMRRRSGVVARHERLAALLQEIRIPEQESWILMVPSSIGEAVAVCALARAFVQTHGAGVTLLVRPGHQAIAEMYPDTFRKVVLLPLETMREFTSSGFIAPERFEIDVPINTWPKQHGDGRLYELHDLWVASGGRAGLDFINLYRYLLRLPWDSKLATPVRNETHRRAALDVIDRHGIVQGKSVILFTGCNTNLPAPYELWRELAQLYGKRDYRVFSNCWGAMFVPGEMPVPGSESIELPLEAVVEVCEHAGTVVTGATGVVSLLLANGFRGALHVLLSGFACRDYVNIKFERMSPMNTCHRLLLRELTREVPRLHEWLPPDEKDVDGLRELARDIVELRPSARDVDDEYLIRQARAFPGGGRETG